MTNKQELDPRLGGGDVEHKQKALGIAAINEELGQEPPINSHDLSVITGPTGVDTSIDAKLPSGRYSTDYYDEIDGGGPAMRELHLIERDVPTEHLPKQDRKMKDAPEFRNTRKMPRNRHHEGKAARSGSVYRPKVENEDRRERMAEIVDRHVTNDLAAQAQKSLSDEIRSAKDRVERLESLQESTANQLSPESERDQIAPESN